MHFHFIFAIFVVTSHAAPGEVCRKCGKANYLIMNQLRVNNSVPTLTWCRGAVVKAREHSKRMYASNLLFHSDPDFFLFSENVAQGWNTKPGIALSMFDQWKNGPGHNANMLREEAACVGVGIVEGLTSFGENSIWWGTQIFWSKNICEENGC